MPYHVMGYESGAMLSIWRDGMILHVYHFYTCYSYHFLFWSASLVWKFYSEILKVWFISIFPSLMAAGTSSSQVVSIFPEILVELGVGHEESWVWMVPSLKLTVRPWKWIVGRWSLPFGFRPIFRGELLVLGREIILYMNLILDSRKTSKKLWMHAPCSWCTSPMVPLQKTSKDYI